MAEWDCLFRFGVPTPWLIWRRKEGGMKKLIFLFLLAGCSPKPPQSPYLGR